MARTIMTMALLFFIFAQVSSEKKGFLSTFEESLENKLSNYVVSLAKWLEDFNDKYLGQSELGRLLHYDEIKAKVEDTGRRRSMKKMGMMGMLPLIFHVGATSTWMVLTTILAAKSVAIGMALLIFKIAVSSAKVAAFFTHLKSKHNDHHGWSWSPHYEHHGHDRSFSGSGAPHIEESHIEPHIEGPHFESPYSAGPHVDGPHAGGYSPDWSSSVSHDYKTIPFNQLSDQGPFHGHYVESKSDSR